MSIDLDWETLTSGPDGDALAERIRSFIHDKFQTVPLPRFIRSVNVHDFDFGSIPPELDLKDITDPLPDFYDQEIADDESDDEFGSDDEAAAHLAAERAKHALAGSHDKRPRGIRPPALRHDMFGHDSGSLFLGTSAPGILGGPGLNYFQSHLGTGTHTPLAAVAGAHLGNNSWMGHGGVLDHEGVLDHDSDFHHHQQQHHHHHQQHHNYHHGASHYRNPSASSISVDNFSETMDAATDLSLREKSSVSTLAPTSVNTSRPPTRDRHLTGSAVEEADEDEDEDEEENPADGDDLAAQQRREPRAEDVQAVFRIRYAGDVRLSLTAEILLDYPMPSFVGIPLKLNITGLSFDGVGLLAKIRKRVHFCFLSPEDALAAVGSVNDDENVQGEEEKNGGKKEGGRLGGLLQEIKVESEIGERDGGKQSLKNVGKVERFVLEQVRRIFEEEFVYPSFWTFLV